MHLVVIGHGKDTLLIDRDKFVAAAEDTYSNGDIQTQVYVGRESWHLSGVTLQEVWDQLHEQDSTIEPADLKWEQQQ